MEDLQVNRDLLDADFQGYKLALNILPIYKRDIEAGIDHVLPSDEQYAYQHAKIFGLHNFLHGDPWHGGVMYFVDKRWKVWRYSSEDRAFGIHQVWEIPCTESRPRGCYNVSMHFCSESCIVLSDGCGNVYIINTGGEKWEVHYSGKIHQSIVIDSKISNSSQLHCLLYSVEKEEESAVDKSEFATVLYWLVFNKDESNAWSQSRTMHIKCTSGFDYAALEESGRCILLGSHSTCKFIFDSEKEIEEEKKPEETEAAVNDDTPNGEELDPADVAEVHERFAHLCSEQLNPDPSKENAPYNAQQLEECDAVPDDRLLFMWLDGDTHKATHTYNTHGASWLFNTVVSASSMTTFCIRHDVDGLVFQPKLDENPVIKHVGTFAALGYVQASKQQRKFTVCGPSMSYVAICDSVRHVYVYYQPSAISSELRNRRTGQRIHDISKQNVLSIDSDEEVMGAYATDRNLFILTSNRLYNILVPQ